MRLVVSILVVSSLAYADRTHERVRYTDAAIQVLRGSGACGTKTARWWCRAVRWEQGTGEALPFDKPLIGRWVTTGEPGLHHRSETKLDVRNELVACAITGTPDHPRIRLETVGANDPDALVGVTRVLEGKDPRVKVGTDLAAEIHAMTGRYPMIAVDGEWYWDEQSDDVRLRKVDGYWIAILSPPPGAARSYPDARLVYVLTDAWD